MCDCFQSVKNKRFSESIVDAAAKYFNINKEEKAKLCFFFDTYASAKFIDCFDGAMLEFDERAAST